MKRVTPVLLILLIATLATGAAVATPQLGVVALSNGLSFDTDFKYGDAFIRVTGPHDFSQDVRITAGGDLAIAFDHPLANGLYKWQLLVVQPTNSESRAPRLENRRSSEGGSPKIESHKFHGVFQAQNGALVMPSDLGLDETPAPARGRAPLKDIVQADDVIIQGSACVGADCVDGESFGSDTLRLKGEDLRLHFDDTSTSPLAPDNDWRIVINDSGTSGASHWTLEDATASRSPFRVEAGAPSAALVVEQDGDIGIGTFSPSVHLHVVDGDAPKLRLEQDGSIALTPQTFDLVSSDQGFSIQDVTNGSQLPFRIIPGADTDSLVIDDDNEVGLGTDDPRAPLHVVKSGVAADPGNASIVAFFQNTGTAANGSILGIQSGNSGNGQLWFGDTDDTNTARVIYRHGQDVMAFWTSNAERMRLDSDGNLCIGCSISDTTAGADFQVGPNAGPFSRVNAGDTSFTTSSSRTLKENLKALEADDILKKIGDVDVYTYDFIDGPKDKLGLMAEDFHTVFGRGSDKAINGQDVQMALWLAVQELTTQGRELAAENHELRSRLEQLEQTGEVQ